jgi:hypothetical protein
MIALAHHSYFRHCSTLVEHPLNRRCLDDCLTLPSRLLVEISNSLKYLKKHSKNLQASCKHGASNANAFRKQCERTNRSRFEHEPYSDSFLISDMQSDRRQLTATCWQRREGAIAQLAGGQSKQ